MGNSFSRFCDLLRCQCCPQPGQAKHLYPISIYRKRAAVFDWALPGSPASVNPPHGLPRPIPLYFNKFPWRYCGRPQAPKSFKYRKRRILRRPPPGRRVILLRVLKTIKKIKLMRCPPPPSSWEKIVTLKEPRMAVEGSVLKTTEDGNGIPTGNAILKRGLEPNGAGPSSINAQQLLGQAEKSSAQELHKDMQPRSTEPLIHNVATEDSKSKEGFAGSASPEITSRRASKRKQPLKLDIELPSIMDLPLAWDRGELPLPPKLPCFDSSYFHMLRSGNAILKSDMEPMEPNGTGPSFISAQQLLGQAEKSTSGGLPKDTAGPLIHNVAKPKESPAGGASPPEITSKRASKRKQPIILDKELPSPMDLPLAWGRGEVPPPLKLPCFDGTYYHILKSTQDQLSHNSIH